MVVGDMEMNTDLLVIGAGPGGYGAAFRAADLGLDVIMVDPQPPGGVCLHSGCIPSKTFLHLAELIHDAGEASAMGISFGKPRLDLAAIRAHREKVVGSLTRGLVHLAERRGVLHIRGTARFESSHTVRITGADISRVRFKQAIIATGSRPRPLPGMPFSEDGFIMDSAEALTLRDIPEKLLVVGGGYIGLELGSFYGTLGSQVTLVEREKNLLPAVDRDLVQPLQRRLSQLFSTIELGVELEILEQGREGVEVIIRREGQGVEHHFDRVLVAIGRLPNSEELGLERTEVQLDSHGFIRINERQQTDDERIYAVGDVAGGVMLAHKATREGRVAAEVICGKRSAFDAVAIPAVAYTDPQISWCGLTEQQAKAEDIPYRVQKFPWKYSGRAQTMGMTDGLTKLITEPDSGRILGVGITGRNAEGLIGEATLAIEMGGLAEDLALTIHPHPTLSETEGEAAEIFQGSPTHLVVPADQKV